MTSARATVRLGIAGCGNVFSAYLPQAHRLQQLNLAQITAFCGRESQRSRALEANPHARFFTDYEHFLESPDLDAVLILTPMPEHAGMTRAALASGRHVLVEKPLATSLEDARQLIELARTQHRHLVCAPFTILSPTFQIIARRLQSGDLGRIACARARYGWAGPDWSSWFYRRGGGALFDLGVYNLTTLTGWLGPVRRVTALAGVIIPERIVQGSPVRVETEDTVQLLLEFESACLATITAGFTLQQYRGPAIELYGTEGTLNLLGDDWDPDGFELWQNSAGCWQLHKETAPDWPWTDGLRHLVECIHSGATPRTTPEHAYHVLEIMTRALAAAHEGHTQQIESRFQPPAPDNLESTAAPHRVHDRTRSET